MYGSPRSYMTDRQGLTWQQTFFKRVISLSQVRWFCSLLNEQWWRERPADGVVTELRVMQVRGPCVAGLLLVENFSGLWVVVVVEEVGLTTCGRLIIGQRARLLIGRSAQGILLRWSPHGRGKGRSQSSGGWSGRWERHTEENKVKKKERTDNHSGSWHMGWDDAHKHLSQCGITHRARCEREKSDVWGVLFKIIIVKHCAETSHDHTISDNDNPLIVSFVHGLWDSTTSSMIQSKLNYLVCSFDSPPKFIPLNISFRHLILALASDMRFCFFHVLSNQFQLKVQHCWNDSKPSHPVSPARNPGPLL